MYMDAYKRWLKENLEDPDLTRELPEIEGDEAAIEDRFAIDLSFGTAGLRGVIGAGTNRMNIYTVRRATQGLANFLRGQGKTGALVAISYDSRIKSELFAHQAAAVLAGNGITAAIYPRLEPVPALSYAVRSLRADAGIMITASHNPAKYNGYKVYGSDGCQMSAGDSAAILAQIEATDIFDDVITVDIERAMRAGTVCFIPDAILDAYYTAVKAQAIRPGVAKTAQGAGAPIKIVYSPLNGAGNLPVRRVLRDTGFRSVRVVPEQEMPDGNFPTCPYPNPEEAEALDLGLKMAKEQGADLMLATDPDADRVGIAVRDKQGAYHLLSGNEVGILLLDYICAGRNEQGTMPKRPVAVKSIVTTPMADAVAAHYGVEIVPVLTGFRYIGEQIRKLEEAGEADRFIFGFEESYGYLAGTHVRDKDAVVASMLICEMAAWHASRGADLWAALAALYDYYGHYLNAVDSFAFEGLSGMEQMAAIMEKLRQAPPAAIGGYAVTAVTDLADGQRTDLATGAMTPAGLPPSNVLMYELAGGLSVIVRPSGTEPKVKVYYTTKAPTAEGARTIRDELAATMAPLMK